VRQRALWVAQHALRDLKDELARLRRPIEVDVQARLIPAFVLGHAFPLASRIDLTAVHRDGPRWSLDRSVDPSLVRVETARDDAGDASVAVVEVSLARDVSAAAATAANDLGIQPGWWARIGFGDGVPGVDDRVAAAASSAFGEVMRNLRDGGVRIAHVFVAAPAALALLLGASVNAGPEMALYFTKGGRYTPALSLPA